MAFKLIRCSVLQKIRPLLSSKQISSSNNNKENTASVIEKLENIKPEKQKMWISYGFDKYDEKSDRLTLHLSFFLGISICFVGFAYYAMYCPDHTLRDWSQREAFIQLRYRERNGLPLIDPNVVDPSTIVLPTDEELGNTDIII